VPALPQAQMSEVRLLTNLLNLPLLFKRKIEILNGNVFRVILVLLWCRPVKHAGLSSLRPGFKSRQEHHFMPTFEIKDIGIKSLGTML
jgi:hypothetical protein